MIVDRDRQDFLRPLLADDVFVEDRLDLLGLRQLVVPRIPGVFQLLADNVVAEFDAFVADEDRRSRNQLANFVLALAAKRTVEELAVLVLAAGIIAHTGKASSTKNQSVTTSCVYNTRHLRVQSATSH